MPDPLLTIEQAVGELDDDQYLEFCERLLQFCQQTILTLKTESHEMESTDTLAIVRTRRIAFFDVRHGNGHLISKTFDKAAAERMKAAFDAEHPDTPCLIQEQTAVVLPEPFYLSKRGKVHIKQPIDSAAD